MRCGIVCYNRYSILSGLLRSERLEELSFEASLEHGGEKQSLEGMSFSTHTHTTIHALLNKTKKCKECRWEHNHQVRNIGSSLHALIMLLSDVFTIRLALPCSSNRIGKNIRTENGLETYWQSRVLVKLGHRHVRGRFSSIVLPTVAVVYCTAKIHSTIAHGTGRCIMHWN